MSNQENEVVAIQGTGFEAPIVINVPPQGNPTNVAVASGNASKDVEEVAKEGNKAKKLTPWRTGNGLDEVMMKLIMALKTYKKVTGKIVL